MHIWAAQVRRAVHPGEERRAVADDAIGDVAALLGLIMTPAERARALRVTGEQLRRSAPAAWRLLFADPHGNPNATADDAVIEIAEMLASCVAAAWLDEQLEIDSLRQHILDGLPEHFPKPHLASVIEAVQGAGATISARALERANEKAALVTRFDPPIAQAVTTKTLARK